jgi:hypothetical protein
MRVRERNGEEAVLDHRNTWKDSDRHYSAVFTWDMSTFTAFLIFVLAALIADFVAIGFGERYGLLALRTFRVLLAMASTALLTAALAGLLCFIRPRGLGRFALLRNEFAVKCHISNVES